MLRGFSDIWSNFANENWKVCVLKYFLEIFCFNAEHETAW